MRVTIDVNKDVLEELQRLQKIAAAEAGESLDVVVAHGHLELDAARRIRWAFDDDDVPILRHPQKSKRRRASGAGSANAPLSAAAGKQPMRLPPPAPPLGSENNPYELSDSDEDVLVGLAQPYHPASMDSLPTEILEHVLRLVSVENEHTLNAATRVNRRFRKAAMRAAVPESRTIRIQVRGCQDLMLSTKEQVIAAKTATLASLGAWLTKLEPIPTGVVIGEQYHMMGEDLFYFTEDVIGLVDQKLPNLERVTIRLTNCESAWAQETIDKDAQDNAIFNGFRNVQELDVDGMGMLVIEQGQWPKLKHLVVHFDTTDSDVNIGHDSELFEGVETHPSLKTVKLWDIDFKDKDETSRIINMFVRNPRMRELTIATLSDIGLGFAQIARMIEGANPRVRVWLQNIIVPKTVRLPDNWEAEVGDSDFDPDDY